MNTKKRSTRNYTSPVGQQLLAEVTPREHAQILNQMRMAVRIADAIDAKGWSKSEFAAAIGKAPSEVSRWLSGTHNFTLDTLSDIEVVLGVRLLQVEDPKPVIKTVVRYETRVIVVAQKRLTPTSSGSFNWASLDDSYAPIACS